MDDLIEELKFYYLEFKNRPRVGGNAGNYKHVHSKYDKDFEEAARLCAYHNISPEEYIALAFSNLDPLQAFPNALSGPSIVEKLETYLKKTTPLKLTDVFSLNKYWYDEQKKKGFSDEAILLTSWIPFEPWFRLCFPSKPIQKVVSAWKEQASKQYSSRLRDFLITKQLDYTRLL